MSVRSSITTEVQAILPAAVEHTPERFGAEDAIGSSPYQLSQDNLHSPEESSTTISARLQAYATSHLGKELLASVVLGTFLFFIGYAWGTKPTIRDIPYQYLENNGEYVRNLSINEEFVNSTVSTPVLVILCVIICPGLQLFLSYACGLAGDIHATLCVYWLAVPLNELVTWCVKLYAGYLRPNFYSQCQPSDNYEYCTTADENGDGVDSWDLRMSFPSGHASWSFCALTLFTFYLERCFGLSRIQYFNTVTTNDSGNTGMTTTSTILMYRGNPFIYRLRSMLCLAPMAVAFFVAASRVVDNKHHPADIVAGSILGYAVASFMHSLW